MKSLGKLLLVLVMFLAAIAAILLVEEREKARQQAALCAELKKSTSDLYILHNDRCYMLFHEKLIRVQR